MNSPLGSFELLRTLFPGLAKALLIGFCLLILVARDSATQLFSWAINTEAAHLTEQFRPVFEAPFASLERDRAQAFHAEQRAAQRRALTRARRQP